MRILRPQKKIVLAIVSTLVAVSAQSSAHSNQFISSTAVDEGAYFHLLIRGLRITEGSGAKPANDTWRDFAAGPAILKVRPSVFDFGSMVAGSPSISEPVRLKNIGSKALLLGDFLLPDQYSSDKACDGGYLPPLAECTFTFTLNPVQQQSGALDLSMPFTAAPDTVDGPTLVGNAIVRVSAEISKPAEGAPEVGITPKDEEEEEGAVVQGPGRYGLKFKTNYQGWPAETKSFELKASGEQPLDIKSISVTKLPVIFTSSNNCPAVLQPEEACAVNVTFNPLELGEHEGELVVETTAFNGTSITVPLVGEVILWDRRLKYSPTVDFGRVEKGSSPRATVVFTNVGALAIKGVNVQGLSAPFDLIEGDCNVTLEPEDTCTMAFSMSAKELGTFSGNASVKVEDLTVPAVPLQFSGEVVITDGVFHPSVFDFGKQGMATVAAPRTITFTNTGTVRTFPEFGNSIVPLRKELADRGVSGYGQINGEEWALLDNAGCKNGVEVGESCSVSLSVIPGSSAAVSMKFIAAPAKGLTSKGTPIEVRVRGGDQSFVYNPTILDFGLVPGGASRSLTVNVTNTSEQAAPLTGFSATVTQPMNNRGQLSITQGDCADEAATAKGSCRFTLSLKAQANGERLIAESDDAVVSFRFSGAKDEFTEIPVKFLLQGTAPQIVETVGNYGTFAVGLPDKSAPTRVFTVFNPGPSVAPILGHTLQKGTPGFNLVRDTGIENNCGSSLAANATCKIALKMTTTASTPWGAAEGVVTVNTMSDGEAVPMAGQVTIRAVYSEPKVTYPEQVHLKAGEHLPSTHYLDLGLDYGGEAIFVQAEAVTGNQVTAEIVGCEPGKSFKATDKCQLKVSVPAQQGVAPRKAAFNLYLSNSGQKVFQGTVNVDVNTEAASFSVAEVQWNAGGVPAQLWVPQGATNPHTKSFLVTNTASRAGVPFGDIEGTTDWLKLNTGGEVNDTYYAGCANRTLGPGQTCAVSLSVTPQLRVAAAVGAKTANIKLPTTVSPGDVTFKVDADIYPSDISIKDTQHFLDVSSGGKAVQALLVQNNGRGNAIFAASDFLTLSTDDAAYPAFDFTNSDARKASGNTQRMGPVSEAALKAARTSETLFCTNFLGLAPGAACTIPLQFGPRGLPQEFTGLLSVKFNEPELKTVEKVITGNSITGTIYYSADNFKFPDDMSVGQTYTSEILIGNGGSGPLTIAHFLSSGGAPLTEIRHTTNCPSVLQVGAECVIQMTLTPDRNIDWATRTTTYVNLRHNEGGVNVTKLLHVNGVSDGAYVQLSRDIFSDMTIESAYLPRTKIETITVESVGTAPVKVLAAPANTFQPFEIINNNCAIGRVLNPGDTCTFDLSLAPGNPSSYLSAGFRKGAYVIQVNGNQKGSFDTNRVYLEVSGVLYPNNNSITVSPLVVPVNRQIDVQFMLPDALDGAALEVAGNKNTVDASANVNSPYRSNLRGIQTPLTLIEIPVPATGTPSSITATYTSKFIGNTYNRTVTSDDFNLYFPGELSEGVYSTQPGMHLLGDTRSTASGIAPLENGGSLVFAPDYPTLTNTASRKNGLYLMDSKGRPVSHVELPVNEGTNTWNDAIIQPYADGAKVFLFEHASKAKGTGYWDTGFRRSHVSLYDVKINGKTLSAPELLYSTLFDSFSSTTYTYVTTSDWRAAYFNQMTNESVSSIKLSSGQHWYVGFSPEFGKFAINGNLTGTLHSSGNEGVVLHENYLYVLSDNSIYTAELYKDASNKVSFRDWTRYQFASALTATTSVKKTIKSIVYDTNKNVLILPCYAYTAVCAVPAREGGIGVMQVIAGQPGTTGHTDGSLREATFGLSEGLVALNPDFTKIGFVNNAAKANRPRILVLSPDAYNQSMVSAKNPEFTLVKTSGTQTVPYDVVLENKSLTPLNVVSLSDSRVSYVSNCDNTPFGQSCTVTIQVPYTVWATTTSGSFLINNTVGAPVSVRWSSPSN